MLNPPRHTWKSVLTVTWAFLSLIMLIHNINHHRGSSWLTGYLPILLHLVTGLSHGDFPTGLWKSDPGSYKSGTDGGEAVLRLMKSCQLPADLEGPFPSCCEVCRVIEGRMIDRTGAPFRCGPLAGPSLTDSDELPPLHRHGFGVGYG